MQKVAANSAHAEEDSTHHFSQHSSSNTPLKSAMSLAQGSSQGVQFARSKGCASLKDFARIARFSQGFPIVPSVRKDAAATAQDDPVLHSARIAARKSDLAGTAARLLFMHDPESKQVWH